MPVRIPIKIFVLRQQTQDPVDSAQTRFVPNVTTVDIITLPDGSKVIPTDDTPIGQPLSEDVNYSTIQQDSGGYFVMTSGGEKLYIRDKNLNTNFNNAQQIFEFYVNPQRITPIYQKLQSEIRTRGGWEIQHWGDALTELRIEGKSGGMHRRSGRTPYRSIENNTDLAASSPEGLLEGQSVMDSTAWQKLIQLKQIYDADHAVRNQEELVLLGISIYDSFYVGYFINFTGPTQEANEPYQFSYAFSMKILYETTVTSLSPSFKSAVTSGTDSSFIRPVNLNNPQ